MTRQEIKNLMNEMLGFAQAEHQARASEILTTLSDEFETVMTASEQANDRVSELTANNETLRAVNAKLFLKVGNTENPPAPPSDGGSEQNHGDNNITFDNLFNDKGELI